MATERKNLESNVKLKTEHLCKVCSLSKSEIGRIWVAITSTTLFVILKKRKWGIYCHVLGM
jgi:hypothetical protein